MQLVDRSKNSSRKDGISHKIGDHKHQFRQKDLGGSNLLSHITANRKSLFIIILSKQIPQLKIISK